MGIAAADYDHRATFFRLTPAQDASGVEVTAPSPIGGAWANVRYGTSSERRTAAGTEAGLTFTVRVKGTARTRSVKVTDRVTVRNRVTGLELTGEIMSAPIPVSGGDLEFTAAAPLGKGA